MGVHAVIGTLTIELLQDAGVGLRRELAVEAIKKHIADPFGWTVAKAAHAIIDIAVANMAEMVRQRSVKPRVVLRHAHSRHPCSFRRTTDGTHR
jgi:N-methylhydantoinase A/oxoprolinase/acetone carboxylase beta subunit